MVVLIILYASYSVTSIPVTIGLNVRERVVICERMRDDALTQKGKIISAFCIKGEQPR